MGSFLDGEKKKIKKKFGTLKKICIFVPLNKYY